MDFDRAMDLVATCLQPPTLTQRRVAAPDCCWRRERRCHGDCPDSRSCGVGACGIRFFQLRQRKIRL
jgi:hypothetical protein